MVGAEAGRVRAAAHGDARLNECSDVGSVDVRGVDIRERDRLLLPLLLRIGSTAATTLPALGKARAHQALDNFALGTRCTEDFLRTVRVGVGGSHPQLPAGVGIDDGVARRGRNDAPIEAVG